MAVEELGPTFIKFGQILADRIDIVPDELREELSKLQDEADPMPDDVAIREIEKELEARGEDTLLQSAAFQGENRELRSTIESLRVQMGEIAKEKQEIEAKASEYRVKTEESGFKSLQTEIKRLSFWIIPMLGNNYRIAGTSAA